MAHECTFCSRRGAVPRPYNLLMNNGAAAGQDIPHAHLHVTPRSTGDGYYRVGGAAEVLDDGEAAALGTLLRETARQVPLRVIAISGPGARRSGRAGRWTPRNVGPLPGAGPGPPR